MIRPNVEAARAQAERRRLMSGKPLIECRICGSMLRCIGRHLVAKHDMGIREYRKNFLLQGERTAAPDLIEKSSELMRSSEYVKQLRNNPRRMAEMRTLARTPEAMSRREESVSRPSSNLQREAARRARQVQAKNRLLNRPPKKCLTCGKSFLKGNNYSRVACCSRKCGSISRWKKSRGE